MRQLTVYFVGNSPQEALSSLAFDSPKMAEEYRSDYNYRAVYSFIATIHPESAEVVS